MQKYFECNLPKTAPYWLHPAVISAFNETIQRIYRRMDTLNEALNISGMDGATFAKYTKMLFDNSQNTEGKFDTFTAEDIAGFVSMMYDGTKEEPRIEWPNAITVVDTAFVTTKEWESIRRLGIGGSDAAVVLGISRFQTQANLYHSKCGTPESEPETDKQCIFDRGHILEPRVIEAFCKLTGAQVIPETRMFASKKYPNCIADIDAIIRFSDGRMYVFEAKSTIAGNRKSWAADKIPAHYVPQMRHYPAVLDDDRILGTYIGCLFTSDINIKGYYVGSDYDEEKFVCRFIERDKFEEDAQMEEAQRWFSDYVERNEVPEKGEPALRLQEIRRMLGSADPQVPPAQWMLDDYKSDIEKYFAYSEEISELTKKTDNLKDARRELSVRMIEKLGTGIAAEVDINGKDYYEIKNAPRSQTEVDTESLQILIDTAAQFLPEELVNQMRGCIVKNQDAFRVFTIKEKVKKV